MQDVGSKDFREKVIARSATVPVVVDFWAPWCGPCRVLGPVLEKEVAALGGRVEMVKVNTDENPDLSYEYQIQGIPAVKAFRDGKVVAEFVGAQPAANVRRFLAQLAPPPAVSALDAAEGAIKAGRGEEVESQVRALADDADAAVANRARLMLARLLADAGRADESRAALARIDARSAEALEIPNVERRLALAASAESYGGEDKARAALAKDPNDLEARYALASALAARGAHREALEELLTITSRDRKFKDDGARLAMLTLFDQLGSDHDLTQEFRRRLQIIL